MITGDIKSKIDQIWNAFWSGGISNPLEVMEQMTYLLFIRCLDEIQIAKEKKANRLKQPLEKAIESYANRVIEIASKLETKANIPVINQIHYEGIDGVFGDSDADEIFEVVEAFNQSAAA